MKSSSILILLVSLAIIGCENKPKILGRWIGTNNCQNVEFIERDGLVFERSYDQYAQVNSIDEKLTYSYGPIEIEATYSANQDDMIRNNQRMIRFSAFLKTLVGKNLTGVIFNEYSAEWNFETILIKDSENNLVLSLKNSNGSSQEIPITPDGHFTLNGMNYWLDATLYNCNEILICSNKGCYNYE